jgi:integrase
MLDTLQIIPRNSFSLSIQTAETLDSLEAWAAAYFDFEVTTAESSRKVQRRDIGLFVSFLLREVGAVRRVDWTPRQSRTFISWMRRTITEKGQRRWGDATVNRIIAHLKTFSRWIHKIKAFPLGNPMEKIKQEAVGLGLEVERAITKQERTRLLDAADSLPTTARLSRDRARHPSVAIRPTRSNFRPYRNRAMIYALTETGMRRAAVVNILLADVDFERKAITVAEKGGYRHEYRVSAEGIEAIRKYAELERPGDNDRWHSPYCFLSANNAPMGQGQLGEKTVNSVWDEACQIAGVSGRTPHSARHAMGKHLIEKTGNIAAVQRQLGHKNVKYSAMYARITGDELSNILNDR